MNNSIITADPWPELASWTDARIALGRAGTSIPTHGILAFQLDHARARDAVGIPCDFTELAAWLEARSMASVHVASRAGSREEYLRRPDLGRLLSPDSEVLLAGSNPGTEGVGLCIVVADGLSSMAIARQAAPFLDAFLPLLPACARPLAPVVLADQARVALSDEIGLRLKARAVLMLVGERPGLSSPDSLGLYFTWNPRPGCQNAQRNCISNVRPQGLSFDSAAQRAAALVQAMFLRQVSGVDLKEETLLA